MQSYIVQVLDFRVKNSCLIFLSCAGSFLDFFPGAICLVFATVWNQNLSFCIVFAAFWHVHLPCCMVLPHFTMSAFHFAWYLPHFGTSTSHVNGMCYMLVLQTFMRVSLEFFFNFIQGCFRVSFRVSLGCHSGYLQGVIQGFFRVSFKSSCRVSLRFF